MKKISVVLVLLVLVSAFLLPLEALAWGRDKKGGMDQKLMQALDLTQEQQEKFMDKKQETQKQGLELRQKNQKIPSAYREL